MHNLLNVSGQYLGAIIITHKQKEEKYHHIVHEKDHVNTISLFKVRNCRGGGRKCVCQVFHQSGKKMHLFRTEAQRQSPGKRRKIQC